jgi:hypothetical protein
VPEMAEYILTRIRRFAFSVVVLFSYNIKINMTDEV